MGNAHTKEARDGARGGRYDHAGSSLSPGNGDSADRSGRRSSRRELSALEVLTGGPSSARRDRERDQPDAPFERRETKQEREARRLERERILRLKEREQSMKEEHVDGGFLVTTGVYTASEDFSKPIVRQLQIERKMAPFWRGLDDFRDNWAEHQIIAAARGLDIPPADQVPENLILQPRPTESPSTSLQNLNNLTVPMGPRTLSAASDRSGSNPTSSFSSPTSPAPPKLSSSLKSPHKALAGVLNLASRNGSQQDVTPREINLPNDAFVNGSPLEVALYKDGNECPICCMYYPTYLNKTRCCDQFICSECFVQIKRPEPHLPDHHPGQQNSSDSQPAPEEQTGELVMEAACCPYCTQTEFGITYEAPPFRRGLAYTFNPPGLGSLGTAMSSSSSSLGSSLSPTSATTPALANRRRAQSLSASDPSVISTDRIRPDWTTKLNTARQQQRRRAAAADALHHAAFVMNQNDSSRSLFSRSSRFSRRPTGSESPGSRSNLGQEAQEIPPAQGPEPGARSSSARTGPGRERLDAAHLESMMMAEAIRLSLADEEDRRKKAEKEAKKEAKKREKEEKKANKRRTSVYGHSEGGSSASASSLSLGFGRKRGNSAAGSQSLRAEAGVAAATASAKRSNEALAASPLDGQDKGKGVERTDKSTLPIPISQPPRGSSHLRQMSNASSISSASGLESLPASYGNPGACTEDPRASEISLGGGKTDDEATGTESMFNFRSLAEMVGVPIDGEASDGVDHQTGRSVSKDGDSDKASQEHHEHIEYAAPDNTATGDEVGETSSKSSPSRTMERSLHLDIPQAPPIFDSEKSSPVVHLQPPSVMVTPETPAPAADGEDGVKQLGHTDRVERPSEVAQ